MKEERTKTTVETPTMKMERDSIKVSSTDKIIPINPISQTKELDKDPVDTHVFCEQISTTNISFDEHLLDKGDHPEHVDVNLIYEVKKAFTEGAQGSIHNAEDKYLGREVVVKKLKENHMRRSFVKEAQLTAQLDHPAIIPIYSLNSDEEGAVYFAMKKVNGVTLSEYLERVADLYYFQGFKQKNESTSLITRLEHFIKICEAIEYAHSKEVIHRDIKPDNIMIGESREVYVMDWGIAYCMNDPENKRPEVIEHMKKNVCGSPGYIDPQILCNPFPDRHTDVYSLGMLLHEMCTLQRGFSGFNTNELFEQAVRNTFPEIKHRFSKGLIASELKAIIEKARNPNINFRYQSVEELAEDVRRLLRNDELSCLPDKPIRKGMRWAQKNPYKMTILMMSLIVSLSTIAIFSLLKQNTSISDARQRENVYAELQSNVAHKAHLIDTQITKLEQLLSRLSASLLSVPSLRNEDIKLYSSNDFMSAKTKPPGTVYSSIFGKEVKVNTLVYKLAPGTELSEVEKQLAYLFSFRDDFVQIMLKSDLASPSHLSRHDINEEKILLKALPVRWIYCGLENGVFVSYPGKGAYPNEYDHRSRPWYKEAKGKRGIHWAEPYYDINGLGLVLPCTISLYNKENKFSGVLALDLTLDFIASQLMFKQEDDHNQALIESVILNADGEILVSSSLLKNNKKTNATINRSIKRRAYPNEVIQEAVRTNDDDIFRYKEGGEEVIYTINRIPTLNWFYLEKYKSKKVLDK
ncbi:serine/threonine protein kinase [Lentisphaera marina]|uniref:serine/threonine protein kinase n=1 Tax=Lentisphaera marina TaxID=1111041 RepID=UPI0023666F17|nr:serine/threonine protein kinase [Lentisphaera marina]MDD7984862.1 serine/threonine protein kinase [Lentisphaera marina]